MIWLAIILGVWLFFLLLAGIGANVSSIREHRRNRRNPPVKYNFDEASERLRAQRAAGVPEWKP